MKPFCMMFRRRRIVGVALSACALSLLTACAGVSPGTPEDAVRARAQARWNALLAGDLPKAYQFLTPASRALMSLESYRARFGGRAVWRSAEPHKVVCDPADRCVVTIKVTYRPVPPRGSMDVIETSVDEVWLLESGQWWLSQQL